VELRLLGSVEVWTDSWQVPAGPPQQRGVLAALAVDVGKLVSQDTIVERVWRDTPPSQVRNAIYVYVSQLRDVLRKADGEGPGAARIVRDTGCYRLDVDPERVDLHRFHTLISNAREQRVRDWERAEMLRRAIGLWRGSALPGMRGGWADSIRQAWHQLRLEAVVMWAQTELRLGNSASTVAPLFGLAAEYPLVESLAAALMRALHGAGCSAQALDFYASLRRRLAEELGTDPAAHLQDLHRSILRGESLSA
jgi:DNA-binding SARP family transcriptional activator